VGGLWCSARNPVYFGLHNLLLLVLLLPVLLYTPRKVARMLLQMQLP
jgi:hypothetical protein